MTDTLKLSIGSDYAIHLASPWPIVEIPALVYVAPNTKLMLSPSLSQSDTRYLLHWQDEDIIIPWPAEMSPKEAILAWAREQNIVKPLAPMPGIA